MILVSHKLRVAFEYFILMRFEVTGASPLEEPWGEAIRCLSRLLPHGSWLWLCDEDTGGLWKRLDAHPVPEVHIDSIGRGPGLSIFE